MRSPVDCWSPLTPASHCMTTSWLAAATKTRPRVSPAVYPKLFFMLDALRSETLPISGLGNWLTMCWLVFREARRGHWVRSIQYFLYLNSILQTQLRYLPCDAMHNHGLCCHAVSVFLSVGQVFCSGIILVAALGTLCSRCSSGVLHVYLWWWWCYMYIYLRALNMYMLKSSTAYVRNCHAVWHSSQ